MACKMIAFILLTMTLMLNSLYQVDAAHRDPCESIDDCSDEFMMCQLLYDQRQNGTCICQPGTIWNEETFGACIAKANSPCGDDSTTPSNCDFDSICQGGTCRCKLGYEVQSRPGSGDLYCAGNYNIDCEERNSTCVSNLFCGSSDSEEFKCVCPETKFWSSARNKCLSFAEGTTCSPYASCGCAEDDDCTDNAICTFSRCKCATEYGFSITSDGKCMAMYGEPCSSTTRCNADEDLQCSTGGKCECEAPKVYENGKCKSVINESCTDDSECAAGSVCHDLRNVCFCSKALNMVEVPNPNRCEDMSGNLNDYCIGDINCDSSKYLICGNGTSGVGTCTCPTNMIYFQGSTVQGCRHLAGQTCSNTHSCTQDSVCINGNCICNSDSSQGSNNQCYRTYDSDCSDLTSPCNSELGLLCSSRTCRCPVGQEWSILHERCVALVSGDCSVTNNLCTSNANCSALGTCECLAGYTSHSSNRDNSIYRRCLKTYNETCNSTSTACNDEEFLICNSETNTCTCEYPLQQEWDTTVGACVSLPGASCGYLEEVNPSREMKCSSLATCEDETTETADVVRKCVCKLGLLSEEERTCRRTSSGANANFNIHSLGIYFLAILYVGKSMIFC